MADSLRYQLSAKTGHQRIILRNQFGKSQFQKSDGALLLTGEFIEHRGPGRKGPHNFAFRNLREPAGFGNDLYVGNQPVSGEGNDFFDDRVFIAETAAKQGDNRHCFNPSW
jgi:hypothetical protein